MSAPLESELKIISDILEGRTQAFEALVHKYQRPIYFLILRMVHQAEEADELTQQVFLKAYKALKGFRGDSSFLTWLSKIALNLTKSSLKKNKKIFVEFDDSRMTAPALGAEKEERRGWMKTCLEALPSIQRQVVTLRIYGEKSFQEIANLLNSKEGTVKVNFHHAMKRLKAAWMQKERSEEA